MELPSALNKKIVAMLNSLSNINTEKGQQELLSGAGLDAALRKEIQTGKPAAFFVPLLVRRLADYGRLKDGRHALEALLEAASSLLKNKKQQKDCEKLVQQVRTLAEKQQEQEQAQPQPVVRSRIASAYVRLTYDQDSKGFNRSRRRELENTLAELLKIDPQFVKVTDAQSENSEILIRIPADKARELVVLFQSKSRQLAPFCEQFAVTDLSVLNSLREIALLSDTKLLPEAQTFVEQFLKQHPQMRERRNQISSTQIKGLENVLASAETTKLLERYLDRQKTKAKRNENPYHKNKEYYLARFYEQLEQRVRNLKEFVGQHTHIFPDAAQTEHYQYQIVREFFQHLIIEYTFRIQSL